MSSSQTTSKMYDPLPVLEGAMRNPLPWLETMQNVDFNRANKFFKGGSFESLDTPPPPPPPGYEYGGNKATSCHYRNIRYSFRMISKLAFTVQQL